MKKRKPLIVFLLQEFTLGIYYHYWIYVNLKNINEIQEKKIFNVGIKMTFLLFFYPFSLLLYFFTKFQANTSDVNSIGSFSYIVIMILGLCWIITNLLYIWQICTQINEIKHIKRIEKQINRTGITILMFLFGIGVINIQMHMNEIIDKINDNQLKGNYGSIIQRRRAIRGRI